MIVLLSPSKRQAGGPAANRRAPCSRITEPRFSEKAAALRAHLGRFSEGELAKRFHLSESKARELYQIYHGSAAELPAIELFQGPAYTALLGSGVPEALCDTLESSLRLLSGMYGYLAPFDLIRSYRLDVADTLPRFDTPNLYEFWRASVTGELLRELGAAESTLLLDLASREYSHMADARRLREAGITVLRPEFRTLREGKEKRISVHAKQGRGLLARRVLEAVAGGSAETCGRERLLTFLKALRFDGYSLENDGVEELLFLKRE